MPCMDFFHEAGGGTATKVKIFMKRAGEAAGESENSFWSRCEIYRLRRKFSWKECGIAGEGENFLEAGGNLLKKRECTLKIDGVVGKVEMHVKNCRGPVEKVGKFHEIGRILLI